MIDLGDAVVAFQRRVESAERPENWQHTLVGLDVDSYELCAYGQQIAEAILRGVHEGAVDMNMREALGSAWTHGVAVGLLLADLRAEDEASA